MKIDMFSETDCKDAAPIFPKFGQENDELLIWKIIWQYL